MSIVNVDPNVLLSRAKIKKFMRMFDELFRNLSLGDSEKVCECLNDELAYFFTDPNEKPSNIIKYVTIDNKLAFSVRKSRSRLFVHIIGLDDHGNLIKNVNGVERGKNLSLTTFIYEYCNPEGLILLEKAFLNYI